MRRAFAETLAELAQNDPRIVLLTADLGFMALEPFSHAHPDRFFNVGVAEQNMIGVATGLAEAGFIPFAYSIVNFATMRPFEFIRNGPVAHRLPVRIVSVGGGMEYGPNGLSHFGLEDVALLRPQSPLTLVVPADAAQARAAIMATWDLPNPVYYRLGKDDQQRVPGLDGRFAPGRLETLREGRDVLILTMGPVSAAALQAADELSRAGLHCQVDLVSSFNPAPDADLRAKLPGFRAVATVEAHYVTGGLGSWAAEQMADAGVPCPLVRCGVAEVPDSVTGSERFMHQRFGLDAAGIARQIRAKING